MNVAYLGPLKDYSGYGEANRHAVAALNAAGVTVMAQMVAYTPEASDFGKLGQLVDDLCKNTDDYKIKILHTTPDQYAKYMERGKFHIGHFFWETDRVPDQFAQGLKLMDEIWTGSKANEEAIRAAGVKTPIKIFPQATETNRNWPDKYGIDGFDGYLFYSIFEWIERKNPEALLAAYFEEFQNGENVGLLIKTYFGNFTMARKKHIRSAVENLKRRMQLKNYPPLFLYLDLMDRHQVMRVHQTGDCFVSAHRGEGWGVPQVEAMLAGKPVISTGYGGVHEYLSPDSDAILLPYEMEAVRGMNHSSFWYTADQNWAKVDHQALREALRWAYKHRNTKAPLMGRTGRETATELFNFDVVGKAMADRLAEIEAKL